MSQAPSAPRLARVLVGLLAAATLVSACGGGGGGETPPQDAATQRPDGLQRDAEREDAGPVDAEVPETPRPDIEIESLNLTLVAEGEGAAAMAEVRVRNTGTATLTLSAITAMGAEFSVDAPAAPVALEPDADVVLTITYTPPDAAPHTGGVVVESDDPDEPRQTIQITGRTAKACLDVSPPTINVGAVELGQPSGRFELAAHNCGDLDVRLGSVATTGHPGFRVGLGQDEGPLADVTVAAGRTTRFDVWFVNDDLPAGEAATGAVAITTDLADKPQIEVGLQATGQESPHCVPQFSPSRLDFGPLRIGRTAELPIDVTNVGNTDCEVLDLTISHEDGNPANTFGFAPGSGMLAGLAPGETRTIDVVFSSTVLDQQGNRGALSLVYTEAGNELNRQERAFLFGIAAEALFQTAQETLSFADTTAVDCASPIKSAGVQNNGLVPICITGARMEGPDCDAFFRTAGPEDSPCLDVAAQAFVNYDFQFQPTHVGAHACDLIVSSDAMTTAEVVTHLRADGVETADTTDTWNVGRLNAQQRAYFGLSRPADALTIEVTVDGAVNDAWHFSNDRNAIYFEVGDHPDMGADLAVHYQARCLERR